MRLYKIKVTFEKYEFQKEKAMTDLFFSDEILSNDCRRGVNDLVDRNKTHFNMIRNIEIKKEG